MSTALQSAFTFVTNKSPPNLSSFEPAPSNPQSLLRQLLAKEKKIICASTQADWPAQLLRSRLCCLSHLPADVQLDGMPSKTRLNRLFPVRSVKNKTGGLSCAHLGTETLSVPFGRSYGRSSSHCSCGLRAEQCGVPRETGPSETAVTSSSVTLRTMKLWGHRRRQHQARGPLGSPGSAAKVIVLPLSHVASCSRSLFSIFVIRSLFLHLSSDLSTPSAGA